MNRTEKQRDNDRRYFNKNKEKVLARTKLNNKISRDRNKKFIREYLSTHPCVDCGEDDLAVLEFDHIDPDLKSFDISSMVRCSYSIETISMEIEKCVIRCANCHRKRTKIQFGWNSQYE